MAMGQGVKIALMGTVVAVAALGIRFFMLEHERNAPAAYIKQAAPTYKITDDDLVFLRSIACVQLCGSA